MPRDSLNKAQLAERRAKALGLRKKGYTYEQIAQMIPTYRNGSQVGHEVRKVLANLVREPAAELIELELMRLDSMLVPILREARAGDLKAADRVLAIMRQRARYLGLNWLDQTWGENLSQFDNWLAGIVAGPEDEAIVRAHAVLGGQTTTDEDIVEMTEDEFKNMRH